jgi:hypothetical protein
VLLSPLVILDNTKMASPKAGDFITAVCRLVYFTTLLVTLPLKIKLSEKERLISWFVADAKTLFNSCSEQMILPGKLLNNEGFAADGACALTTVVIIKQSNNNELRLGYFIVRIFFS